ncbi:hypothetical protein [Nodosilinea sp. P-1105]|uniref:hypothetical protein n=1 Tax=Nodosilinea sp. P-1105 TaxID=2546229 RepID=UPI00146DCC80|nr:hypothetical protein [Nodosilinea sp. P-1105]NMF83469.1 hypothetical protein [Nodosilinea sp. P-1105]
MANPAPEKAMSDPGQSSSPETPTPTAEAEASTTPLTQAQGEQILAELKRIKQNLFWVLLVAGFFAARAIFFHY